MLLTGMFFYYAFDTQSWALAIACYIASFTLDFFDGYFARLLDQCSGTWSSFGYGYGPGFYSRTASGFVHAPARQE